MFRLNPNAVAFVPRAQRAFPALVRQVAVPNRRVSFSPDLVTETKVFDFTEGSSARSNPTGKSRLCRMKYKRMDSNEKIEPDPVMKAPTATEDPVPPSSHDDWLAVMGWAEISADGVRLPSAEKAELLKDIEIIRANLNYCE